MAVTKNYSVAASADDAIESSIGAVVNNGIYLKLEAQAWGCGIRFSGVDIAQGTSITSATLRLTGVTSPAGAAGDNDVFGIDEDDLAYGFSEFNKPSDQTKTTASTVWDDPAGFTPDQLYGTWYVDVTAQVQEILDRGGWSPGNAMGFVIDVDGATYGKGAHVTIHAYDHASYPEPKLEVIYPSVDGVLTLRTLLGVGI